MLLALIEMYFPTFCGFRAPAGGPMTHIATAPIVGIERSKMNSIVFASCFGTIIEWYDFLIYATAATLIFNKAFFPTFDPLAGTLAALGSDAVGFLARPLGGALVGHFGDRLGRKSMLVLTLFIMGISTFCIGLLPTYASIGVFAPTRTRHRGRADAARSDPASHTCAPRNRRASVRYAEDADGGNALS